MFHVPAQAYALRRRSTKKTALKNVRDEGTPRSSFDQISSVSHDSDYNVDANGCCPDNNNVGLTIQSARDDLRVRFKFSEHSEKLETEEEFGPERVVIKDDQNRFPQPYTIKLKTGAEYLIGMEVRL